MKEQQARTPDNKQAAFDRPIPLIVVTALSYVVATTIAMNPAPADPPSAAAPTPYSADHARIVNEEPQPPTF